MPQTGLQSPGVANILSISHVALSLPFDLQLSTYNNAYWFLPKIFAHDWHVKHTWPVTGLQLSLTNQCYVPIADTDLGRLRLGAQLTKPHLAPVTPRFVPEEFLTYFIFWLQSTYLGLTETRPTDLACAAHSAAPATQAFVREITTFSRLGRKITLMDLGTTEFLCFATKCQSKTMNIWTVGSK